MLQPELTLQPTASLNIDGSTELTRLNHPCEQSGKRKRGAKAVPDEIVDMLGAAAAKRSAPIKPAAESEGADDPSSSRRRSATGKGPADAQHLLK